MYNLLPVKSHRGYIRRELVTASTLTQIYVDQNLVQLLELQNKIFKFIPHIMMIVLTKEEEYFPSANPRLKHQSI